MGCFNTRGFLSKLELEYLDEGFLILGYQRQDNPIDFTELNEDSYDCHDYDSRGHIIPLSFPIFGEYNDYGKLKNIKKDFNVLKLEDFFEDSIDNIIEVIYNCTYYPHYMSKEEVSKYYQYKNKLGFRKKTIDELKEYYEKFCKTSKIKITLEEFIRIESSIKGDEKELIWTIDYKWVYDTLGQTEPFYQTEFKDKIDDLMGSIHTIWCEFGHIWTKEELENYCNSTIEFSNFLHYISNNNDHQITTSYPTGQDVDWSNIAKYSNALNKFIQKKLDKWK